jgi:hypothetical protein
MLWKEWHYVESIDGILGAPEGRRAGAAMDLAGQNSVIGRASIPFLFVT